MKTTAATLIITLLLGLASRIHADEAFLSLEGSNKTKLDLSETDFVRENLIHIFDSANFHQMQGGSIPVKSQEKIKEQLIKVQSGLHIEIDLEEATKITVDGRELKMKKMWASIRTSDGFIYDWIFAQPDDTLISLEKARGGLVVQFAPYLLKLIDKYSEESDA